jgi:hypothetical protein
MAKTSIRQISDGHSIARYAGYSKLRRDRDGNAIGVLYSAFELRPATATRAAETYLSSAWLDSFPGARNAQLKAMVVAYDPHPLVIKPSGAFAIGKAGEIKAACSSFKQSIRIVNSPRPNLACYVEVRQFNSNERDLLDLLADEVWSDITLVKNI